MISRETIKPPPAPNISYSGIGMLAGLPVCFAITKLFADVMVDLMVDYTKISISRSTALALIPASYALFKLGKFSWFFLDLGEVTHPIPVRVHQMVLMYIFGDLKVHITKDEVNKIITAKGTGKHRFSDQIYEFDTKPKEEVK